MSYTSNLTMVYLPTTSFRNIKGEFKAKAAVVSGEGGLLSFSNSTISNGQSLGVEMQPEAIAFGALTADTAPASVGFPEYIDEFDSDIPTQGFSSIPEAIKDIRQGKVNCL